MQTFDYLRPETLEEALTLLKEYGKKAFLTAGGTDVFVMIKKKTIHPEVLIFLQGIPGLGEINGDGPVRIGARVTHRTIEKSAVIRRHFQALADAVDALGTVQVRNMGTLGGNICNAAPSADTATPLLVLGAQVKIVSLHGERWVSVEEFFRGPGETVLQEGEMVTELIIPRPLPHTGSAYSKHTRRLALDLPMVGVSVLLSFDRHPALVSEVDPNGFSASFRLDQLERDGIICRDVRIALSVVAPTPIRTFNAERLLRGKR